MLEDPDRLDRATRRVFARERKSIMRESGGDLIVDVPAACHLIAQEYQYLLNAEACGAMMKRMGEEDEARRIAAMFAPVHRTMDQLEARYEELKALPHIGCDP